MQQIVFWVTLICITQKATIAKHLYFLPFILFLTSCGPTTYVERPVAVERPVYYDPILIEQEPMIVREGGPVIVEERRPEVIERRRVVRGRRH